MTVTEVEEYEEAVVMLQRNTADLILLNEATADFLARQFNIKVHKAKTDFHYQTTFGFKKDNLLLGSIMSKAILAITLSEKQLINDAWRKEPVEGTKRID